MAAQVPQNDWGQPLQEREPPEDKTTTKHWGTGWTGPPTQNHRGLATGQLLTADVHESKKTMQCGRRVHTTDTRAREKGTLIH